ncbi:hypothetical protein HYT55_03340 [Candidatus Woesearchaeota archaeon]|nr:hypothetical protein [Candidatus Woesearchaeota archaeon]
MRKRGLLIVLVIVLLISLTINISAADPLMSIEKKLNDQKVLALGKIVNAAYSAGCDAGSDDDCWYDGDGGMKGGENIVVDNNRVAITLDVVTPSTIITGHGEYECDNVGDDLNALGNKGNSQGCFVGLIDKDSGDYDDGAVGYAAKGTILDHQYKSVAFAGRYTACDDDDANDAKKGLVEARFKTGGVNGPMYLCSGDSQWHICKDDRGEENPPYYGTYSYGEGNSIYNCSANEQDVVTWIKLPGVDNDHDLYTDLAGDCRDDPTNDPQFCKVITTADCSGEVGALKYASCAVCINPSQPERGGDGIDNSCTTGKTGDSVLTVDDNMDLPLYKEVCNQEFEFSPESSEQNRCCGDDGIRDVGAVINTLSGEYLCLNGQEGEKEWKWISAGVNKFTIFTVNKIAERSYDLVSNGERWKACSASTEGKLEASAFFPNDAARFYCSSTDDEAVWADCAKVSENGIKQRTVGQGVFDLMNFVKDSSIHFSSQGGFTAYEMIYGKRYPSFAGYDYLDVYFQFTDETLEEGVGLRLDAWSTKGKIATENVMGYVINGASLVGKKTYHAQIPMQGWRDVTIISFVPVKTTLELKNVHLSKKGNDPVCAGNLWLDSLDAEDLSVEEGQMCTALGLAWLGDKVEDPSLRCCGNTAGEYGVGDEKGCWNSQSVDIGQRMTNVQFELTYGKGEWTYGTTAQSISADVVISSPTESKTVHCSQTVDSSQPTKLCEIEFSLSQFRDATLINVNGSRAYFADPLQPEAYDESSTSLKYDDLLSIGKEKSIFYVMGVADTLTQAYSFNPSVTETLAYSCDSSPCRIHLKGVPPYTIHNNFPQKYDLYFVTGVDGKEIRTLIDKEKTVYAPDGWLEVDAVPLQVLFAGTAFLGCGDTTSFGAVSLVSEKVCFAQKVDTDGFYCDPFGNWKNDELPMTSYDAENNIQLVPGIVHQPGDRNHTSSIVFGRNLLENPMLSLTK